MVNSSSRHVTYSLSFKSNVRNGIARFLEATISPVTASSLYTLFCVVETYRNWRPSGSLPGVNTKGIEKNCSFSPP